jgi:hypothetical protein
MLLRAMVAWRPGHSRQRRSANQKLFANHQVATNDDP